MQIASFFKKTNLKKTCLCVIILTSTLQIPGCALLGRHAGEWCKTRAYVKTDIEGYINQRFTAKSPVRVGVIPFSVPANLAHTSGQTPSLGNKLAWAVQRKLLASKIFPIIEVLNREDWPRKKDQFFSGNFGALAYGRDAGYDMIVVGYMEPLYRLDTWTIHTKVIEVASGTTLWFGSSTAYTTRHDMWEVSSFVGLTDRRPDFQYSDELLDTVTTCATDEMLTIPEDL